MSFTLVIIEEETAGIEVVDCLRKNSWSPNYCRQGPLGRCGPKQIPLESL